MKLTIDKNSTVYGRDEGTYHITVSLTQVINGAQMPPFNYELTLEIVLGDFIPYVPKVYPPLKMADPGINYPIAQIRDVLMNGTFKIKISKPLAFPDTLIDDHAKLIYGEVPLSEGLKLSEESEYI